MKLRTALLAATAAIVPVAAHADPVTAFFAGLGMTSATTAAVAMALNPLAFAAGAFFTTGFGALIANIGISLLMRPSAPNIGDIRVNSRREDSPRWQLGGRVCAGGESGIFGEFDAGGNFWYICAHGDNELIGQPTYMLDGIEVTLSDGTDGFTAGDVLTDDFCLDERNRRFEGGGTRVVYYRLYPVTPDATHLAGALPADFLAAFPDLPADFLLAGVCHTVVRCKVLRKKDRGSIYHWRGGFGLGEPTVNIIGDFSRIYDPRDPAQDVDDSTTWGSSGSNPALLWAWWRTNPRGRGRPVTEINWDLVADAADACDGTVLDRTGTPIPRYRCGVAFPDSRPRHECESEILRTMCAFVAYDDQGRAYPVAGVYEAPTLTFYGNRDVLDYQTQIIEDGEAALDGVVVEYISPEHGWTRQRSAPWVNTAYYDGAAEPNYQVIQALGCQNHNQAVRIAKDHGLRIGAVKKAALTTGLRGMLATTRRNITLDIDAEFSGDFEIATPVQESADGQSFAFAVVPMQADRFDLNEGEEGLPPQITPSIDVGDDLEAAANVVVSAVQVSTSSGSAVRIEATFDAPVRVDREFVFRISLDGSGIYEDMTVDMDELRAWSAIVEAGAVYEVQWQTTTAGGRATDWSTAVAVTASVAPISFNLLAEPAPDGVSRSVSGLPDGTQMVMGDGEWWRRVSNGKIASAADYIALFDSAEYQIEQVDKTRAQVLALTRASAATYIDAAGLIQTAAADVARIDHSGGTPALLVEPTRENLHTYSDDFSNASWSKANVTVTSNAVTGPDGATSGDTLTSGNFAGQGIYDDLTVTPGTTVSHAVWVKLGTMAASAFKMAVRNNTAGAFIAQNIVPAVTPTSTGWTRVTWQTVVPAGCTSLRVYPFRNSAAVAGTVHLWNAQTEAGAASTSDIVTGAAPVTRAADVPQLQGITATLDLTVRDGDGIETVLAGQGVSPGFWPTLTTTRIRQIIGRTP